MRQPLAQKTHTRIRPCPPSTSSRPTHRAASLAPHHTAPRKTGTAHEHARAKSAGAHTKTEHSPPSQPCRRS
eukprot:833115-Rhodomonas_salina.1